MKKAEERAALEEKKQRVTALKAAAEHEAEAKRKEKLEEQEKKR